MTQRYLQHGVAQLHPVARPEQGTRSDCTTNHCPVGGSEVEHLDDVGDVHAGVAARHHGVRENHVAVRVPANHERPASQVVLRPLTGAGDDCDEGRVLTRRPASYPPAAGTAETVTPDCTSASASGTSGSKMVSEPPSFNVNFPRVRGRRTGRWRSGVRRGRRQSWTSQRSPGGPLDPPLGRSSVIFELHREPPILTCRRHEAGSQPTRTVIGMARPARGFVRNADDHS